MSKILVAIPIDETTPVLYVGCYPTRWGKIDEPTVGFRDPTLEELQDAILNLQQQALDEI